MGFDSHDSNTSNGRVIIDFCDEDAGVAIDHVDVEVNDEVEFEVRGRIEDLDEDVLEALGSRSFTPAELHLCTEPDAG